MGIGENGHIAFNDPHVADFDDKEIIKPVKLDDVPEYALTLTIPNKANLIF